VIPGSTSNTVARSGRTAAESTPPFPPSSSCVCCVGLPLLRVALRLAQNPSRRPTLAGAGRSKERNARRSLPRVLTCASRVFSWPLEAPQRARAKGHSPQEATRRKGSRQRHTRGGEGNRHRRREGKAPLGTPPRGVRRRSKRQNLQQRVARRSGCSTLLLCTHTVSCKFTPLVRQTSPRMDS
jgi:hypothetical protein